MGNAAGAHGTFEEAQITAAAASSWREFSNCAGPLRPIVPTPAVCPRGRVRDARWPYGAPLLLALGASGLQRVIHHGLAHVHGIHLVAAALV